MSVNMYEGKDRTKPTFGQVFIDLNTQTQHHTHPVCVFALLSLFSWLLLAQAKLRVRQQQVDSFFLSLWEK